MPPCLFCAIVAGSTPADVVLDEPGVVGFLDVRPVFAGHVLLVPRTHRDDLLDASPEELAALLAAGQRVAAAFPDAVGAVGAWLSINHRVSQSVPHLHLHVVPRTKGDGLRGFFWPRSRYGEGEAAAVAERIRAALAGTAVGG